MPAKYHIPNGASTISEAETEVERLVMLSTDQGAGQPADKRVVT